MLDPARLLDPHVLDETIDRALQEDGAWRDVTTATIVPPDQGGRGVFLCKGEGIVAGLPVVEAVFARMDSAFTIRRLRDEGEEARPGDEIAVVEGPLGPMLSAERVALNFLQRLSGIATLTRQYVDRVAGLPVRITDTRKTTPGLRPLERYAVRIGGGHNHRYNLADAVLIKDNHLVAARTRGLSVTEMVRRVRLSIPHTMRLEIEATTEEDAIEAIRAGADIVLLDNMDIETIRRVAAERHPHTIIEASGGVTLDNVRAIAETGVDVISVGALTHSARALDVSLEVDLT
ncbi:MAG TPA: carboxylating nicotinate-nucleotide diphosphorylase [Dehalococcoidia bacterium]|nr:carboxylating nicotinate-nucleotide diphosphorylase [Dehalococcoidia bacterium]